MVDHYSNIDLVFRNGLKEFEALPPEDMWVSIAPSIKKPRSLTWLQAAAITAITITTGILAYSLSHSLTAAFNGQAITLNQDSRPVGRYIPSNEPVRYAMQARVASSEMKIESTKELTSDQSSLVINTIPVALRLKSPVAKQISLPSENNLLLFRNHSVQPDAIIQHSREIVADYYVPVNETTLSKKNRWSIGAVISPTYYSMFDDAKSDPSKRLASSENTAMSYSGGLSFAYKANKRISLQMGVYYSSLNHEIDGVLTYSGFTSFNTMKGSDNFFVQTANGPINSRNKDIFLANTKTGDRVTSVISSEVFNPAKAGLNYVSSSVYQKFNYIEIPFIIRYKVIDKTLGMNLVGGISYNQLLSNSAYAVSEGNKYFIGSTDGVYPITLSSSFGVGMEYSLSKKLSINLEPTFRYYLTPMSGQASSTLHPYTFGVFSGFTYKF